MSSVRPALREPWLWLVIGIPLATLFGAYLTLRLAYQNGASDTVPDEVVRTGQAQDVELAPDREAARRGLIVSLTIDPITGHVAAIQNAGASLPRTSLQLQFVHPLRSDHDRTIKLLPGGIGWQAQLPRLHGGDWQLVMKDPESQWRLVGRMPRHALRTTLRPALSPPAMP